MEATARLDQAGAKVQRRPRAVYVSAVDDDLGVSTLNGNLFWQKRVSVTTIDSRFTASSEVVLTVVLLPEREVDWPPGLAWGRHVSFCS